MASSSLLGSALLLLPAATPRVQRQLLSLLSRALAASEELGLSPRALGDALLSALSAQTRPSVDGGDDEDRGAAAAAGAATAPPGEASRLAALQLRWSDGAQDSGRAGIAFLLATLARSLQLQLKGRTGKWECLGLLM